MHAKSDLFNLIKSLTKTEKAYFKKYTSIHSDSEKAYLTLFDLIHEQDVYDEELLKKTIQHKGIRDHFSVHKNYLYKVLMRSLANYIKTHSHNFRLEEMILEIEVLLSKNLFSQCTSLIKKAKIIANQNENYTSLLKVIQLEIRLIKQSPSVKNWNDVYKKVEEEENEALKKLMDISVSRNLNADMFLFFQTHYQEKRTPDTSGQLSLILHRLKAIHEYSSAECEINHLSAWVNYYKYTEEPEKALPYQKKAIAIFKKNPILIHNEALRYINSLSNLLILEEKTGTESTFRKALSELKNVKSLIPDNLISPNLELHVFALALRHELIFLVNRNQFSHALTVCNDSKKKLLENVQLINQVFLYHIFYCNARIFFELKKSQEFTFWSQKIIRDGINKYNKRYHFFVKMLSFLMFWNDENPAFVESLGKSLLTFIKKQKIHAEIETLVILKLMSTLKPKPGKLNSFRVILEELLSELTRADLKIPDNYFDYKAWIQKQLQ